jgi:hypothetical protein
VQLGFIPSDACVLVVQATMVLAPRRLGPEDRLGRLAARLQSRWWALVPLGSIVVVIFAISAASGVADGLTWLALIAIPILAALAFGWAVRGARWWLGAVMGPLLALAWLTPSTLWGEGAATLLTAFSCVTLGVLLAGVCPPSWLKVGIVLMALGDSYLVLTDLLQAPNNQLVAAAPHVAGLRLPQLQGITFGDILLGYGDVFVAAVLGGVDVAQRSSGIGVADGAAHVDARRVVRPVVLRARGTAGNGAGRAGDDRGGGLAVDATTSVGLVAGGRRRA